MRSYFVALIIANAAATAAAQPADVASEHLFPITVDGRQGFIDHQGRVVIEPRYEFLWGFSEGLASVWVDKKAPVFALDALQRLEDFVANSEVNVKLHERPTIETGIDRKARAAFGSPDSVRPSPRPR